MHPRNMFILMDLIFESTGGDECIMHVIKIRKCVACLTTFGIFVIIFRVPVTLLSIELFLALHALRVKLLCLPSSEHITLST